MRKLAIVLAAVIVAAGAAADTVVLKGGKRLEVERFTLKGNYLILRYAGGRMESYSLNAVDLAATEEANRSGEAPAPQTAAPSGPHSPFFAAQAKAGAAAVTITDADVEHIVPVEEGVGEEGGEEGGGTVSLVSYERRQVGDNLWEITANVANNGDVPIQALSATISLADREGNVVGSGTGLAAGQVQAGQQTTITARIQTEGEPFQVSFDFRWQAIRPVPKQAGEPAATAPEGAAGPREQVMPEVPRYEIPAGSTPTTLPNNPMALPPLTEPPADVAPQVPRPQPTKAPE